MRPFVAEFLLAEQTNHILIDLSLLAQVISHATTLTESMQRRQTPGNCHPP